MCIEAGDDGVDAVRHHAALLAVFDLLLTRGNGGAPSVSAARGLFRRARAQRDVVRGHRVGDLGKAVSVVSEYCCYIRCE